MTNPARLIANILFIASGCLLSLNAHADGLGTATLDLRVRLLNSGGTLFSPAQFSSATVLNRGYLSFQNGFANAHVGEPVITVPELIDLPVTCIGNACPVTGENDFAPLSGNPEGFFSNGDQRQTGSLLAGDFRNQVRADAGVQSFGAGHYGANASSMFLFDFTLDQPGAITFQIDATPYVSLARPKAISEPGERAAAGTLLFISLHNNTSNQRIFAPEDPLNDSRRVIDSDYDLVDLLYDPGALTFSITSPVLNAGDSYTFGVFAEAFASISPAPEPSSLAMFGAGLAALLIHRWRRKACSLLGDTRETTEAK